MNVVDVLHADGGLRQWSPIFPTLATARGLPDWTDLPRHRNCGFGLDIPQIYALSYHQV